MGKKREDKGLITECLDIVPNHFMLALGVAKRSKALKEGMKPFVEVDEEQEIQPVLVSLQEVKEKKVDIYLEEERLESDIEDEALMEMDMVLDEKLEKEDVS